MWTRIPHLMRLLLSSGFYHGSPRTIPLIAATIVGGGKEDRKDDFEFQMLYGVRTDLQRQLVPMATICASTSVWH